MYLIWQKIIEKKNIVIAIWLLSVLIIFPMVTLAEGLVGDEVKVLGPVKGVAGGAEYNTQTEVNLTQTIATIIQYILSFLGVAFLLIIIYAGVLWLLAGGNEEKLTAAKDWLRNGVIGLAIIFGAYAIVALLLSYLGEQAGYSVNERVITVEEGQEL